ncbi:hypothetical protein DF19_38355 [Streptomyces olindensis]|nr:hypothetical protein DF19_38355 [Streptomyces olindensis]
MRVLGNPAHLLMVQVPIGSWLSTAVLDLYPGSSREAVLLVRVGLASATSDAEQCCARTPHASIARWGPRDSLLTPARCSPVS